MNCRKSGSREAVSRLISFFTIAIRDRANEEEIRCLETKLYLHIFVLSFFSHFLELFVKMSETKKEHQKFTGNGVNFKVIFPFAAHFLSFSVSSTLSERCRKNMKI